MRCARRKETAGPSTQVLHRVPYRTGQRDSSVFNAVKYSWQIKEQAVAGLLFYPFHIEIGSLKTYCATNPLDVVGTVMAWPRGVSDPSALTRNPISAPAPETL